MNIHADIAQPPSVTATTFIMSSDSPHIKFEHSPVDSLHESFVSTPGTAYPSLFHDTMDPSEVMTPQSYDDDSMFGDGSMSGTPAPEKKPVKKRKSWGQQLPEPKTNLPPRYILDSNFTIVNQSANPFVRKRAKTEDEKEQRRVERVLRNRRAAQSSRERKRQEVEALEAQKHAVEVVNQDLQRRLNDAEAKNILLQRQLEQMSGGMSAFHSSSVASSPGHEQLRQTPSAITFSQDLFGSREAAEQPTSTQSLVEPQHLNTVDPAALSPEMGPVVDSSNATSSDLTQHPAAMLCDLPCQSEDPRPWMDSTSTTSVLAAILMINLSSTAIWMILSPLSQILTSLRTGSSLPSTSSIISLIIWLTTTAASLKTTPSMSSSTTTTSLRPRFSLRICLLRRLLACSPNLARPLMDATMVAMRSASEQQLTHACLSAVDANRLETRDTPSVEALMTLLWAIQVIEKERMLETSKPEAATTVRPDGELDELFRLRDLKGLSHVSHGMDVVDQKRKSFGLWRTAFKHDRP